MLTQQVCCTWSTASRTDPDRFSNSLYYIRSEDGGDSWSAPSLVLSVSAPEPSSMSGNIAVDETGRVHVAWDVRSDQYASFSRLGYIRSTDSGETWAMSWNSRPEIHRSVSLWRQFSPLEATKFT